MNIIFLPVDYDKNIEGDHWRIVRPENNYKIVVCQFNDNIIDERGYDYRIEQKGFKWGLAKHFLNNHLEIFAEHEEIEYIGIMDDDLIMSYQEMNNLLAFAKENNMDVFQPAVTPESNSHYTITVADRKVLYTRTNFIEGMCIFMTHKDSLQLLDFLNYYDVAHGWELGFILHQLLRKPLYIIHAHPITHPYAKSSYNIEEGGAELRKLIREVAPKYFYEKRQEIWSLQPMTIFMEKRRWQKTIYDFM